MATDGVPHLVKAIHNFKGTNNDELCFKKGDIITVTQIVEGGWWEGTLNGITGWFPSNYVKDHKPDATKPSKNSPVKNVDGNLVVRQENMKLYRSMVFKDMLDTEATHIQELQHLWQNFLLPLQRSDIVNEREWQTLVGNLEEVLECQKSLLSALEEIKERAPKEQRIGGVFMQSAPQIKAVHLTYCANHPKAVVVIEKHRDALSHFMEEHGAPSPGILALTTGLSRLFRRLEKYSALLQELQRHTEESHVDRGDTQRAAYVYRDISSTCVATRRQKEMELEVMTGTIRDWEGEEIQTLGDLIHMGPVVVLTEANERKDRYLVLFAGTLVILSVSSRRSAFVYEGKLPLSAVNVKRIEPSENFQHAFEITGSMIQRIVVICHNSDDVDNWLSLLQQQIRMSHLPSGFVHKSGSGIGDSPAHGLQVSVPPSPAHNHLPHMPHGQPPPPPHIRKSSTSSTLTTASHDGRQTPQMGGRTVLPFKPPPKMWTMWSLRPHPPMRPCLGVPMKDEVVLRRSHSKRKAKSVVSDEKGPHEDDMKILQVIEAYCTSAKTRYTVNSALLDSPQVLIAEEEKIIVEETRGNTTVVEQKSLVDTVYALKDQVKELKEETANLAKNLEEEKHARQRLETLLRKCVFQGKEDLLAGLQDD